MNTIRIFLFVLGVLVVSLCFIQVKNLLQPDIAYVDIAKLVNGYKLKKDLEAKSTSNMYRIKAVMDSLQMVRNLDKGDNPHLDSTIAHVNTAFQQYYVESNKQITQAVWERLNPVIERYGNENHIAMIVGADGAGNILYADKARDVTDDLLSYVNMKYDKSK